MGTCSSQQSSIVCRPETLKPCPTIDPTTTLDSFHPELEPSESELRCRKTVEKLVSVKEFTRSEVAELLTNWEDSGQLSEIENHALSITPKQAGSINELAKALTHPNAKYMTSLKNSIVHTNIAKAYVIYYWVATNINYDDAMWQSYLGGDKSFLLEDVQSTKILAQRKTVSTGYSNLYQALARKADLEVEVIKGNVKTWKILSNETATGFTPNDVNGHIWNMVKLANGVWFPVDCTFGSGYVDANMKFSKTYSRHYFAPLPHHLILTHWPPTKNWQLLKNTISLNEYQDLIPLSAPVFARGILPQMWCEKIYISEGTKDPVATVRLHRKPGVSFSTSLIKVDPNSVPSTINTAENSSQALENNIFVEENEDEICFRVALPKQGCYALNIYAGRLSDTSALSFRLSFSYIIECNVDPKSIIGYPTIFTKASKAFEFEVLHWNLEKAYSPENETGTLDIVFRAQSDLQFHHYLLPGIAKTTDDSSSIDVHSTMIVSKLENDDSRYMLRVLFPSKGWWTIYLCAAKSNNADFTTSGYTALLNFQIYAKTGLERASYPHIYVPYIAMDIPGPIKPTGSDLHSISFRSLKSLEFNCYLTHEESIGEQLAEFIKVEKLINSTTEHEFNMYRLHVVYPQSGKWFVHVFAKEKIATEESYQKLIDFPVYVEHSMKHTSFAYVDTDFAEAQGIIMMENDLVNFSDCGKPLLFHFKAPYTTDFMHILKPYNSTEILNPDDFPLSHCTYLSTAVPTTTNLIADYTLRATFPSPGRWTIEVYSKCTTTNTYGFVFHITIDVTKPIIDACFPKLHHAFYQLGLNIPDENMLYNTSCEATEFELPFEAPDDVTFSWNMQLVGSSEQLFQHSFVHHCNNSSPNRTFHLLFSECGEWIARLYAKRRTDANGSNGNHHPVLDIQIKATKFTNEKEFPQLYEPFRDTFQLNFDKSCLPIISRAHQIPCTITIPFLTHSGVKFWHDATLMDTDIKTVTRMISNEQTGVNEITAELTENGKWLISLYAQCTDTEDKIWITVMQHTVITM